MPPKTAPQPRKQPDVLPDSLPDREDPLPGDLRRSDQRDTPDSLTPEDDVPLTGSSPALDGGADDHPIHDEPMEDLGPEDFERLMDDAERGKLEKHTEDEELDERANTEFALGSSEPLDLQDRGARLGKP